jgi:L-ascorbate metabolism protein UlaG (beta-lactamase superfamily)
MSAWTVEWFGTATFRARRPGLDLFFDGYLDRLPGLDPVGLSIAEVERADFIFVSHAHFDHLYGVAPIARGPAPPWSPPRRAPASSARTASPRSSS